MTDDGIPCIVLEGKPAETRPPGRLPKEMERPLEVHISGNNTEACPESTDHLDL